SGKKHQKDRELGKMLRQLRSGDTLIVTELSRLSRTLTDIMAIMGRCLERNITLYSTKDGYAFDDSINSKVLCFAFGLVAEIERNLISMRTKEALALRKAEGVQLGRRKGSYTKLQILIDNRFEVIRMIKRGYRISTICRHFGVSRDTFNTFRERYASVGLLFKDRDSLPAC
ncbi:MAG: recombinase family protein, partial [Rikenellaceae bacterium]|nr:recombinase family protein [Rikenellaceae bacterium]